MLKRLRHLLFAATAMGLIAASSVACGRAGAESEGVGPTPDTLALVEGLRLFEENQYDRAREQLEVSARSQSNYIRAESFLYLNALEMELGNYDQARVHLDHYHSETMRMLQRAADSSRRMEAQAARLRRRHDTIVAGMLLLGVLIVGAAVFVLRRPKSAEADAGTGVAGVGPPLDFPLPEWERWMEDAAEFGRTGIYAEIAALAAQTPGRNARVLTLARQDVLEEELGARFSAMSANLRRDYPTLTAGDVKLCCLAMMPLTAFGRALCWGSTETNIVKQRKHTIKKKLCGDERGRALFEFLFRERR